MLKGMRQAYEAGDWDNAHKFAASAAPYIHPKLQAIEHGGMEDNRITVVIQRFSGESRSEDGNGNQNAGFFDSIDPKGALGPC
jgi:hypothetical protein